MRKSGWYFGVVILGLLSGCVSNGASVTEPETVKTVTQIDEAGVARTWELTAEEWQQITEMMRVYITNTYVSSGKTVFEPKEYTFCVYVDDSAWAGGDIPRYYAQIEKAQKLADGQTVTENAVYYIWEGADQSWHITPWNQDGTTDKDLVGEGQFILEDTDKTVFEDYPNKEERLIDLWKMSVEKMCINSDLLTGQHEILFFLKNITQYDDEYPVWYAVDDQVHLLSAFYTGYGDCDMWDINDSIGWKTATELEQEKDKYYMTVTGTVNGLAADSELSDMDTLKMLCGSALGYLKEMMWTETGNVSGSLAGRLYFTEDSISDNTVWVSMTDGSVGKLVFAPEMNSWGAGKTFTVCEEDWTAQIPEDGAAVIEFDFDTRLQK